MSYRTAIIIGAATALLAACSPVDPNMGASVKHNSTVQIIDPDPDYAGTPGEGSDGTRAATAVERYKKGAVKEPVTQAVGGSSGSGGGGRSSSGG